jgi:hypothetical protein
MTHEERLIELAAGLLSRARIDAEEPYGYSPNQRADIIRKGEANADACLAGAEALRLLAVAQDSYCSMHCPSHFYSNERSYRHVASCDEMRALLANGGA